MLRNEAECRRRMSGDWGDAFNPFEAFQQGFGPQPRPDFHSDPLYKHICQEAIEYFSDLYKIDPKLFAQPDFRMQLRPDMKERIFGFMQQRLDYWGKEGFVLPKQVKK